MTLVPLICLELHFNLQRNVRGMQLLKIIYHTYHGLVTYVEEKYMPPLYKFSQVVLLSFNYVKTLAY